MKNIASQADIVLNGDGSVYHLCVRKEHLSNKIVLVGDPDRVEKVMRFMENARIVARHREFITARGWYNGADITVVSTGIGTDNIDIVMNELDLAWNLIPGTRTFQTPLQPLSILRIGTCGGTGKAATAGSFVMSGSGLGLDGLALFYQRQPVPGEQALRMYIQNLWPDLMMPAYVANIHPDWLTHTLNRGGCIVGNTLTSTGFYGPQGRITGRYNLIATQWIEGLASEKSPLPITNLEMETAAMYFLSDLLGFKTASLSVVLANRDLGEFSANPEAEVNRLIPYGLSLLASFPG